LGTSPTLSVMSSETVCWTSTRTLLVTSFLEAYLFHRDPIVSRQQKALVEVSLGVGQETLLHSRHFILDADSRFRHDGSGGVNDSTL
jgi:hypothetical protein